MNVEQYLTSYDSSNLSYKFQSVGPNGIINKVVLFKKMNIRNRNFYTLSLGDWDETNGNIDYYAVSNNSDTSKVLFTVGQTELEFVSHYQNAHILIVGSTMARTRLYQMAIAQNFEEIDKLFEIEGFINGQWGKFKTGINFEGFLMSLK
jgi:hypothetical protein